MEHPINTESITINNKLYALFVDKKITAVFENINDYNKWIKVIYCPKYCNNKKVKFEMEIIENIKPDNNYAIYLVKTESQYPLYYYFKDLEEATNKFNSIIKNNKNKKICLHLIKIIIGFPYLEGCLYEGILSKYPRSIFRMLL